MKKIIILFILLFAITGCKTQYSNFFSEAKKSDLLEYNSEYDLYEGLVETQGHEYYYVKMGNRMAYFYKLIPTTDGAQPYEHFYFWANVNGGETISVVDYDTNKPITTCSLDSNCGHDDKEAFDSIRAVGKMLVVDIDKYLYSVE